MKFTGRYPQNYYQVAAIKLNELRIAANTFVPVPLPINIHELYREMLRRHHSKNKRSIDELEVILN